MVSEMRIVKDFPPNIDKIRELFPLTGKEIFAWGDIIYSPSTESLPPWLLAHENVHKRQQDGDPEKWWARYLADPYWRFEQELEAHRAEYRSFCALEPNRNRKRVFLKGIARRLSAPMYGRVASFEKAKRLIKQ